jgi:putative spermidine/putrescine transport system substrate-binding protein
MRTHRIEDDPFHKERTVKHRIILSLLLSTAASVASADVNVMSWGGAYGISQEEAYIKPFQKETGIPTRMIDSDNPGPPVKAMVEAGNVTVNVADFEYADAVRMCDEGLLEEIDPAKLPPAPDGTPATEDFLEGALTDCSVASALFATVIAYDTSKFPEAKPSTVADFFDTKTFPGKRSLRKSPKSTLEFALMADGVPAAEVYEVLSTPEGVDRAFAKLDSIKDDVVWWEAGAQPPQLLADGEVAMTTSFSGRIFSAAVSEGKPFATIWDGQIYDYDVFAIPKGAPDQEEALKFIAFATDTQRLADQAKYVPYGPARRSSVPLLGLYQDGKTELAPNLPTHPANMTNSVGSSYEFWADHDAELTERFNSWLAGS